MRTVTVNGDALTIEDVVDVARGAATAELDASVAAIMEPSRSVVAAAIEGDAPVYGVNTGFGALADTSVGARDLERLQGAIVRSGPERSRRGTRASGWNCPPGCSKCSAWGCCRWCPARDPWARPGTWLSSRTWPRP